jgi:hypothetical protein
MQIAPVIILFSIWRRWLEGRPFDQALRLVRLWFPRPSVRRACHLFGSLPRLGRVATAFYHPFIW